MLKKISFFAFVTLLLIGCSSDPKDEKEERGFKDSVYAFINSKDDVIGFGRIDLDQILKDGKVEQNTTFQMFAAPTYESLQKQLDLKTPVYMAMTTTKEHTDPTIVLMVKLKSKEGLVKYFEDMNFVFKEHEGITYSDDGEKVIGLKKEMAMIVMAPGKYEATKLIAESFKRVEGKVAPKEMQQQIEAKGDFVMHLEIGALKDSNPSLSMMSDELEADITLNFEKGKMVLEATSNNLSALQKQLGAKMQDKPVIAKKITGKDGAVIMAMQLRMTSALMDMAMMSEDYMELALIDFSNDLARLDDSIELSEISNGDKIIMPESGQEIGSGAAEIMVDCDALSTLVPKLGKYIRKLDYASYEMKGDKIRVVIAADNKNDNFLATALKSVDESF